MDGREEREERRDSFGEMDPGINLNGPILFQSFHSKLAWTDGWHHDAASNTPRAMKNNPRDIVYARAPNALAQS